MVRLEQGRQPRLHPRSKCRTIKIGNLGPGRDGIRTDLDDGAVHRETHRCYVLANLQDVRGRNGSCD